ncbi:hypothetical protein EDD17DRAFT_1548545 [Pisolithus thermaeus]|nr:hypothetical protein EDD17DRAFT_1548545 [Pisolithus thermaeus]
MSHPWRGEDPGPSVPMPQPDTPESDLGSVSPRTALLSHPDEQELRDHVRGPSHKFRRRRERAHSSATPRELLRLLINEEYESRQTRKVLHTVFTRLEQETRRALDAQKRLEDSLTRARTISDARVAAQQDAARAKEELSLYKLQLETAQAEILRAQEIVHTVEAQRDEAEVVAASARTKARQLRQERLIDLAREEGRRLGFEEGIRRGRRIRYREDRAMGIDDGRLQMEDVATSTVDRLLAARDEFEEDSEPSDPPLPREVHPPPDLDGDRTPTLEQRPGNSRRRRNPEREVARPVPHISQPIVIPASPAGPPPGATMSVPSIASNPSRPTSAFSRPVSLRNVPPTVNHVEIHVPPEGYIPTADPDSGIVLPPPHELQRNIPSPTPSQRTIVPVPENEGVKRRDFAYESHRRQQRRSSIDSTASTKLSASTMSQLGDLVGLPGSAFASQRRGGRDRDRSEGLSVIHEVSSSHSMDYPSSAAGPSHSGRQSRRNDREPMDSEAALRRQGSRQSKQQLADELRYSDTAAPEEWRRQGAKVQSQASSSTMNRHRPSQVTTPAPLSPLQSSQPIPPPNLRGAPPTFQPQFQGHPSYYNEADQRRLSSGSSVPDITIEPPSGPSSDAPSRGTAGRHQMSGFLSPDHANIPLPIPPPAGYQGHQQRPSSPASLAPTVPNSPVIPNLGPGQMFDGLSDGQLPTRYTPTRSSANNVGDGPVIPQNVRPAPQRYSLYAPASPQPGDQGRERQPESVRNPYTPPELERDRGRDQRSRTYSYPTSPTPAGMAYPAPPVSRGPARPASPSQSTLDERRRSAAGMTPGHTPTPRPGSTGRYSVPSEATVPGGPGKRYSVPGEATSNASSTTTRYAVPGQTSSQGSQPRGGHQRYDPRMYNDPAYLSSRESLDTMTDANTAANAGRGGRIPGSPTRRHERLR